MREDRRRRAAWSVAAAVLAVPLAGAPAAATDDGLRVAPTESPRVAAAIVWPSPRELASGDLPEESVIAGARALLAASGPRSGEPRPLLLAGGHALIVGYEVSGAEADRLTDAIGRLSRAADPGLDAARSALRQPHGEEETDRLLRDAERLAVGALTVAAARPEPASAEDVLRAIARIRAAPRSLVVAGPRPLADALRAASQPLVPFESLGSGAPRPGRHYAIALDTGFTALSAAYRVEADEVAGLGSKLVVLAETLREGAGSLSQRLQVAVGAQARSEVLLTPLPRGGAALVLSAVVPAEHAPTAWRVMEGTASSSRQLPVRQAALVAARKRLDVRAAGISRDPASIVTRTLLEPEGWSWPGPDRWSAPLGPDEHLAISRQLLGPERRAIAVTGRVSAGLARAAGLEEVFGGDEPRATESADPLPRLVQRLARLLGRGAGRDAASSFSGEYLVVEPTPLGDVAATLRVSGSGSRVDVRLETRTRKLHARADGETEPGGAGRTFLAAARQPSVLLGLVESGLTTFEEASLPCGGASCPALVAVLADGTELALVLDNETAEPRELQVRWCCERQDGTADEVVRYLAWKEIDGVRMASRMVDELRDGSRRSIELRDWSWGTGAQRRSD